MNVNPSGFALKSPPAARPKTAMVLAAGLGKRMRPLTVTTPKPLLEVGGRALIDHALDRLHRAGIAKVIVNVHYLAQLVRVHLARSARTPVEFSDESSRLLDTGGGIANALPQIGDEPFYLLNSDSFWIEGVSPNLDLLADAWRDDDMDALVLVCPTVQAIGYSDRGDFLLDPAGRVQWRPERDVAPFVYAGTAILHPRLFNGCPPGPFPLKVLFDRAIEAGRLFGVRLDGVWFHVGTPASIELAELAIADSAA